MGRKEAEEAAAEVTSKAYKRLLSNAVTSGALDKAASKAEFLQDLCDNLRFDPDLATAMHAGEAWGRRRGNIASGRPRRMHSQVMRWEGEVKFQDSHHTFLRHSM